MIVTSDNYYFIRNIRLVIMVSRTILLLLLVAVEIMADSNLHDLLDSCLDAENHKSKPDKESFLFKQCLPWKDRSCCTYETTEKLHQDKLSYAFQYSHCKKALSSKCERHFIQDHCFYECSPNIGPWIVKVDGRRWRHERFYGVPLCADDCQSWFEDCKDDYTCTDNWARNFDWKNISSDDGVQQEGSHRCPHGAPSCKVNVCPLEAECRTFQEIYGDAHHFCQTVWDGSWSVVPSDRPCMRLWFNGSVGNPNTPVAAYYVQKSTAVSLATGMATLLLPLLIIL